MQGKFTININNNVTETTLVETCLCYKHSGYDYKMMFFLYSLGVRMHIDKFTYYMNMLEEKEW